MAATPWVTPSRLIERKYKQSRTCTWTLRLIFYFVLLRASDLSPSQTLVSSSSGDSFSPTPPCFSLQRAPSQHLSFVVTHKPPHFTAGGVLPIPESKSQKGVKYGAFKESRSTIQVPDLISTHGLKRYKPLSCRAQQIWAHILVKKQCFGKRSEDISSFSPLISEQEAETVHFDITVIFI